MFLTGQVTRDHLSGRAQGACIGHMDSSLVLSVMGPKSLISVSIQFLRSEEAAGQSNTAAAFLEPPHHWESSYSPPNKRTFTLPAPYPRFPILWCKTLILEATSSGQLW